MANFIRNISWFSSSNAKIQEDVEENEWFSWIRRYNKTNDEENERGDNNKIAETAPTPEPDCETTLATGNTAMTPNRNTQCAELEKAMTVIDELRKNNIFMASKLSFMGDRHHEMEQMMKSMKDNYKMDIQNQQAKLELVVTQLKDEMTNIMANTINHDQSQKEDEIFFKKELCKLRDNFYLMEHKMKRIDDSVLSQNHKYNKAIEKLQVTPELVSETSAKKYSELQAEYEKMNLRVEKLVTNVNSLKREKQTLLQTIGKMAKEIKSSKRNNILNQKGFEKFKGQIKNDVEYIKKYLNSLENTTKQAISNVKPENISCRKYEKLKMRLTLLEKAEVANQITVEQMRYNMTVAPSAYIRGAVNDSMANVHYEAQHQQAQSPHSVTLSPPSAPASTPPKIPPPPPCGPPPPPSSFVSPAPQSGPPRYTINNELLKAMSSELRKPDGTNIRKIPKRQDMKIPTKVEKDSEQKILLPRLAAPLPVLSPEAPIATSEQTTLETLESTDFVPQTNISEVPLAVVDTLSALDPPAQSEIPTSSVVDSESTDVSLIKVSEAHLAVVDSQSASEPSDLTEILSPPLKDSESTVVPQEELESLLPIVDSEIPVVHPELLVTLVDSETPVEP